MKKALFVTLKVPFPADSGGKIVSSANLKLLTKKYKVDFVSNISPKDSLDSYAHHFKAAGVHQFYLFPHWIKSKNHPIKSVKTLLKSFVTKVPYKLLKFHNKPLYKKVVHLLKARNYDVVVFDQLPSFQMGYSKYLKGVKTIMFSHNAEFETVLARISNKNTWLKNAVLQLEAKRLRKVENQIYQKINNVVFLTLNDAIKFNEIQNKSNIPYYYTHYLTLKTPLEKKLEPPFSIFIIGTWSWDLNLNGLQWFLKNVEPLLDASIRIKIGGAGISKSFQLKHIHLKERCEYLGYINDMRTMYSKEHAVVIPLFGGSGVKIKVLDALMHNTLVVTTDHCAEGFAEFDAILSKGNTPEDFANEINILAGNVELFERKQLYLSKKISLNEFEKIENDYFQYIEKATILPE